MIRRSQSEHERINAREYPGTRQLCFTCEQPTGRCEDDSMYDETTGLGPLCEACMAQFQEAEDRAQMLREDRS